MADDIEALKDRIRDLEACLYQGDVEIRLMALTFSMPLGMARLLGLLRGAPVVTPQMADERIGMGTDLRVAMHRLRRYLHKHEIEIQSQYAIGYWLAVSDKEKITRLIHEATTPPEPEPDPTLLEPDPDLPPLPPTDSAEEPAAETDEGRAA